MQIAFLFFPCSQCMYSNAYKAKGPETAEIMQLCTAKTRLGMKMADTHTQTDSQTDRAQTLSCEYLHSVLCPYTQHPLLKVGILTLSQGSTLHNSLCRRAKAKNREWQHVGSTTQREKIRLCMEFLRSINMHMQLACLEKKIK